MLKTIKELMQNATTKIEQLFTEEVVIEDSHKEQNFVEVDKPVLTETQRNAQNLAAIRENVELSKVFKNRQKNGFNELVVSHFIRILKG